jgi:hypothetical protein
MPSGCKMGVHQNHYYEFHGNKTKNPGELAGIFSTP